MDRQNLRDWLIFVLNPVVTPCKLLSCINFFSWPNLAKFMLYNWILQILAMYDVKVISIHLVSSFVRRRLDTSQLPQVMSCHVFFSNIVWLLSSINVSVCWVMTWWNHFSYNREPSCECCGEILWFMHGCVCLMWWLLLCVLVPVSIRGTFASMSIYLRVSV